MLASLSIKNYAIIRKLDVSFSGGFCVLTGETGAGKSIIMGALGLILGQRADTTILNNVEGKCVVEGRFVIPLTKRLKQFFNENDLDSDVPVIMRREISPAGKSRAFINDTPVQLSVMKQLGVQLIDIHSQHSNLELGERNFQLDVLDWFSNHKELLDSYAGEYSLWRSLYKEKTILEEKAGQIQADQDYFQFQFNQLDQAQLQEEEQEELEQEQEQLSHTEEIKSNLGVAYQLLSGEGTGIVGKLKEAAQAVSKIANFLPEAKELSDRLESQYIDLNDVAAECEQLAESSDHDPKRLDFINERLNELYSLQQKHRVDSVRELIELRDDFDNKLQSAASFQDDLEKLEAALSKQSEKTQLAAQKLSASRVTNLKSLEKEIAVYLEQLGMPNAALEIRMEKLEAPAAKGIDEVSFLFTANKGGKKEEIHKVASGGELSRLMLAIKTVVAKSKELPAIIFDEIDSGISGEIASKMGKILKSMAAYMQVISITHLPQIASQGDAHYLVFKEEDSSSTQTDIRVLSQEERVIEIAKMLSGEKPNEAAISNARSLIDN